VNFEHGEITVGVSRCVHGGTNITTPPTCTREIGAPRRHLFYARPVWPSSCACDIRRGPLALRPQAARSRAGARRCQLTHCTVVPSNPGAAAKLRTNT
jgi:hypothetical protein